MPIGAKIHTIARPTMNNSSGQSPYLTTEGFGTGNVDTSGNATPLSPTGLRYEIEFAASKALDDSNRSEKVASHDR